MKGRLRRLRRWLVSQILSREFVRPEIVASYEYIGTEYGGWAVLLGDLERNSVIYSVGVGNDVSFDQGLASIISCNVHLFDPTPGVRAWLKTIPYRERLIFYPLGLWDQDERVRFYPPRNPSHVSCSVIEASSDHESFLVDMKCLRTLMSQLGHTSIDLLKMDIEGAEYRVIRNLLSEKIYPRQLLIEFHHGHYGIGEVMTVDAIQQLREIGYKVFYVSDTGHEVSMVRGM